MLSDLRFAFRQLAKTPGFTAIVVVTLALSIGACTAIYSALDNIVLRPYDDPETNRNVWVDSVKLSSRTEGGVSAPDFTDLERQAKSFEIIAQHSGSYFNITGSGEPLRFRRIHVTPHYFDILGLKMALGRAFLPEEFVAGNDQVMVLGHGCWQRVFGGAPDIIGRVLIADDVPCTVVGILPESFERTGNFNDAWVPRTNAWTNSEIRTARSTGLFTVARCARSS